MNKVNRYLLSVLKLARARPDVVHKSISGALPPDSIWPELTTKQKLVAFQALGVSLADAKLFSHQWPPLMASRNRTESKKRMAFYAARLAVVMPWIDGGDYRGPGEEK